MGNLRKVITLAVLGALILGVGLSSSLAGCKKEDEKMDVTKDELVRNVGVPAIDASVPWRTETATFALG